MCQELWTVEIEPEIRRWLGTLSDREHLTVEHAVERLLNAPATLGEPYSRHLGDGLRELRFVLGHDGNSIRITYWLAPARRIVLLNVFRKTRMREDAEVERAHRIKKDCTSGVGPHSPATDHDPFTRSVTKGESP